MGSKGKRKPGALVLVLCVYSVCVTAWMAALPTTNKLAVMATHTNNAQTNRQHDQQQKQLRHQQQQPQWYNFISELWKKVSSGVGSSSF